MPPKICTQCEKDVRYLSTCDGCEEDFCDECCHSVEGGRLLCGNCRAEEGFGEYH